MVHVTDTKLPLGPSHAFIQSVRFGADAFSSLCMCLFNDTMAFAPERTLCTSALEDGLDPARWMAPNVYYYTCIVFAPSHTHRLNKMSRSKNLGFLRVTLYNVCESSASFFKSLLISSEKNKKKITHSLILACLCGRCLPNHPSKHITLLGFSSSFCRAHR